MLDTTHVGHWDTSTMKPTQGDSLSQICFGAMVISLACYCQSTMKHTEHDMNTNTDNNFEKMTSFNEIMCPLSVFGSTMEK